MVIDNVKIGFSPIGVHSCLSPRREVCYMLFADISYLDGEKKKRVYLNISPFIKKKDLKGCAICETLFVATVKDSYYIFNPSGELTSSLLVSEIGKCVGVQQTCFLCLKGNTITGYDVTGSSVGSYTLTEKELSKFEG